MHEYLDWWIFLQISRGPIIPRVAHTRMGGKIDLHTGNADGTAYGAHIEKKNSQPTGRRNEHKKVCGFEKFIPVTI